MPHYPNIRYSKCRGAAVPQCRVDLRNHRIFAPVRRKVRSCGCFFCWSNLPSEHQYVEPEVSESLSRVKSCAAFNLFSQHFEEE